MWWSNEQGAPANRRSTDHGGCKFKGHWRRSSCADLVRRHAAPHMETPNFSKLTDAQIEKILENAAPTSLMWHGATTELQLRHTSGDATWRALQGAVDYLVKSAPQDHDVLLQMFNLTVLKAQFIKPHTFLFEGIGQDGNRSAIVAHFSQVVARVVYLPKRSETKVITGFAPVA
jgi:hypothetical protein